MWCTTIYSYSHFFNFQGLIDTRCSHLTKSGVLQNFNMRLHDRLHLMRFLGRLIFLSILILPFAGCLFLVRRTLTDHELKEITIHGITRRYILHVPKSYKDSSHPNLVMVLHGGGGNGRNIEQMSGFTERSDRDGFLVVYPYGTNQIFDEKFLTWNAGNCCGAALDKDIDDTTFLRQLILFVKNQYDINKVYVTGLSNGGMMTYRLACESADIIDGIAPVSGAMNIPTCQPARPLDVIIFHGRDDQHILYDGGQPQVKADSHERRDQSVAYAENFWRTKNQCHDRNVTKTGNVETVSYSCDAAKISVISIDDEGHTWPGGSKGYAFADPPTKEVSATDEMLRFWLSKSTSDK